MASNLSSMLKEEIEIYMSNAELELISAKSIRLHLESKFGQSFAAKKQAIKSHILDVLARTSVPSSEIQHSSTVDDSPQGGIQRGDSAPDNQAELHHKAAGIRKRPRKDDKSGIIQASELVARAAVVQYTKPGEALDTQKSDSGAVAASKVPATTLPLVLPRTNQRGSKATILVQADRQDEAIDLSGDVGAVGRMTTSSSGVILDLQGHRYAGNFVPCHSYLVVSLGASEAKIEHVCQEFVQLEHLENVIARMGGSHFANDEEGSKISQLLAFNDVDDEAEAQSTGAGVPMLGVSRKVSSKRKRARRK